MGAITHHSMCFKFRFTISILLLFLVTSTGALAIQNLTPKVIRSSTGRSDVRGVRATSYFAQKYRSGKKLNFLDFRGGHSPRSIIVLKQQSTTAAENDDDQDSEEGTISRGGGTEVVLTSLDQQPTLMQILRFALPCLALWIAQPLLSLVDTITVGLSAAPGAGAAQLGALGPATTFIDGATFLFAFLNTATTNLYASSLALAKQRAKSPAQRDDPEYLKRAGNSVARTASKISLICGFFLMILLITAGKPLLRIYVGGDAGESILQPASEYIWVRAWSLPTSLLYGVVQAALLGAKDSITPLVAILYSTIVNSVGDVALVCFFKQGVVGAAIATVAAQWAGTAAMIVPARRKLFVSSKDMKASATTNDEDNSRISSRSFLAFAAPVLTLILGKLAAFGIMTHVAAALPGNASLAAHQIALTLFFFISPFLEVISQTAQSFLPPFFVAAASEAESSKDKATKTNAEREAGILSLRLLKMGVIVGMATGSLASLVPRYFPQLVSNDGSVQEAVRPLALPLLVGALLTAPVAVSEGILLAKRELGYLASVYVISTALLPPALIYGVKLVKGPVVNVWWGFAFFQLFRATCFTGRLWGGKLLAMGHKGKKSARRVG
jgi:Na+-driven multidrug efflux pump